MGSQVDFSKLWCVSVPKGCYIANSADPDEMQHHSAFLLGLHCLPKYPFRSFLVYKGLNICFGFSKEPSY